MTRQLASRLKLCAWLALLLCGRPAFALLLTNVSVVNITPSSFSLVWATTPGLTPSVTVYSDSGSTSNLAGQVGVQWYPVHTGDPTLTNNYYRRQNQLAIQQATISQGLVQARVSGCTPGATYYYSVKVADTNGQSTTLPASGALPSVTTALENDFVAQGRQLVLTVPATDPAGSIVILSSSNSPSLLAAVVGDGVASNEVCFNLSDLLAAGGQTNYLALGTQNYDVDILSNGSNSVSQTYSLNFTGDFLVGEADQFVFAQQIMINMGSAVLRAGQGGSLPISLNTMGVASLSFVLNLPTNRFSALTLQALSPQVGVAAMQTSSSNTLLLSFTAAPGQRLQGNEQLAQINFTTMSNQSSAFVYFRPLSPQALNADGSSASDFLIQNGRIVIVGPEPLVDSLVDTNGTRELALYGIPGDSYQVQSSANFGTAGSWADVARVPMTNLVATLTGLDKSKTAIFYRAYEFTTLQPILDFEPAVNGKQTMIIYGTPWSAYEVDYAASLGLPQWNLLTRAPLTNSFQVITGLNAGTAVFYRSKLLNADPPILIPQLSGSNRSMMIYGLAGTNYGLQYATNISPAITWNPLLSYRLTNSFQTITNLGGGNPPIYYRLKKQ